MAEQAIGELTHELVAAVEAADRGEKGKLSTALTEKSADHQIEFGFEYRDIPFVVRAVAHDLGTDMEIRASLGNLPYTAENPEGRMTALAIVKEASRALGGRVTMDRSQRIVLAERYRLEEPLTPTVLLTRTVQLVLAAKPYLELLSLVVPPPLARRSAA